MFQVDSDVPLVSDGPPLPNAAPPLPETHTIKDVMNTLKCGHSTAYRLIEEGELTLIKVFGKSLVLGLRDYIERKTAEARQIRPASATANNQHKLASAREAQQPVSA